MVRLRASIPQELLKLVPTCQKESFPLPPKRSMSSMVPISIPELMLASRFLQYRVCYTFQSPCQHLTSSPLLNSLQLTDSHPQPSLLVSATPSPLSTLHSLFSLLTHHILSEAMCSLFPSLYALDSSLPSIQNRNVPLSHTMEQPCHQFIQLSSQIVYLFDSC